MILITYRYRKHCQGLSPHKRACNFRVPRQNQKPLYWLSIPPPSARIFLSMTTSPYEKCFSSSHNRPCNFRVPRQNQKPLYWLSIPPPSARIFLSMTTSPYEKCFSSSHNRPCNFRVPRKRKGYDPYL